METITLSNSYRSDSEEKQSFYVSYRKFQGDFIVGDAVGNIHMFDENNTNKHTSYGIREVSSTDNLSIVYSLPMFIISRFYVCTNLN